MKEYSICDWEAALARALSAKNSLININGFSPHQIVFGKNIKILSIYVDQPSADLPENEIVIRHLNAFHTTRQAFIATESSHKLKLALRKRENKRDKQEIFMNQIQKSILKETLIKSGEVLVLLSVRMGLLYLLDKEVYFTKFIVHGHKKSVILIFHQQSICKLKKIICFLQSKNK